MLMHFIETTSMAESHEQPFWLVASEASNQI